VPNQLHVLIQPVVLRFSLQEDELVYFFAADADAQLDRMERMMGIDPTKHQPFDANLGFLPVSTTVLIRGDLNIVVDPGNHHTGFYGQLGVALGRVGLTPDDIDLVVSSHCHHDHMSSISRFPGTSLVMGEGEVEFSRELYGEEETHARLAVMGELIEVPRGEEIELSSGVVAVSTPGHTPGHISVMVETESGRMVMAGDAAMTRKEYEDRAFSHWYTSEQVKELNASLSRLQELRPAMVFPGHDRAFRPSAGGI
jgi:N-acyl homoserine lactone hydrolase